MRVCKVDGCEDKYHANGYCKRHSSQIYKYGKIVRVGKRNHTDPCKIEGCDTKHYANGYCKRHDAQIRRSGKITRVEKQENPLYKTCQVDGCSNKHYSKGYCTKHYSRALRHDGDAHVIVKTEAGEPKRWLDDYITEVKSSSFDRDVCTVWPYAFKRDVETGIAYGHIRIGSNRYRPARYIINNTICPSFSSFVAIRECDTELCVNPYHYNIEAQKVIPKLTNRHHASKLSVKSVIEIYTDQSGASNGALAEEHNVSVSAVRAIRSGTTWRWLTEGLT